MDILYLLVPLSVVLVFLIAAVFLWALRSGQFDDLEGPAFKVLLDDDRPRVPISKPDEPNSAPDVREDGFDLCQKKNDLGG